MYVGVKPLEITAVCPTRPSMAFAIRPEAVTVARAALPHCVTVNIEHSRKCNLHFARVMMLHECNCRL